MKEREGPKAFGSNVDRGRYCEGTKCYCSLLENDVAFLPCYILQMELSLGPPERVGN